MIDLFSSEVVEVQINHDGTKIWVNTEHGCQLRIYRIGKLEVVDERPKVEATNEG